MCGGREKRREERSIVRGSIEQAMERNIIRRRYGTHTGEEHGSGWEGPGANKLGETEGEGAASARGGKR